MEIVFSVLVEVVGDKLAKMTPILKAVGMGCILTVQPQIVHPLVENLDAVMVVKVVQVRKMQELLAVLPVAEAAVHQVVEVVGPQVEQVAVAKYEYGCIK